jgi:hypothetical protein
MDAFKRNYLQHALAVSQWMQAHDAKGGIDPRSQMMEIHCNGRTVRFWPQFMVPNADGGIGFTPHLQTDVTSFVSWLPYFNKKWPVAQDKLAFKAFAHTHGLRTPAWSHNVSDAKGAFIAKAARSSLGVGLRGPFQAGADVTLADGEYVEQFIIGRLLKAWYWNGELAVAEVVDMPTVRGDGQHTVRQLAVLQLGAAPGVALPEELLHLQRASASAVPRAGQVVVVEYRYMSPLNPAITQDHNVRDRIAGSALEASLAEFGRHCLNDVPADLREHCAFSVDGVIDQAGQLWFLEVNCNPLLHPSFYDAMLSSLFLN